MALSLFTITAALGCSHSPAIQEYPDTASASEEVAKFSEDMQAAESNQINMLSPYNFEQAHKSLEASKKNLEKKDGDRKTLHSVAEGRAYLNRAIEFGQLSTSNLKEVIAARNQAITADAHNTQSVQFREADEKLRDMTRDIEKNELKTAVNGRSKLQLVYLELELKSIKQVQLGQSRERITQAIKEGAKEFAPRSLAIAEKSMFDTDAFITANRHNSSEINARSTETNKITQHLLKITKSAKSGQNTSAEESALKLESEQGKVAAKQGQLDNKQVINTALVAKNSDLESQQAFNRQYEEAQRQFTSSEAQVYKQGNVLTIRLRGLEFPNSQAVLKGSDFTLLAKVQKVIKSFGASTVVVEGHTDSNGGKVLNKKLSTDRAEAVKDYFVANADGDTLNITAIGYDYQKPLATNKSPQGRAQNRRVDVLIQPVAL